MSKLESSYIFNFFIKYLSGFKSTNLKEEKSKINKKVGPNFLYCLINIISNYTYSDNVKLSTIIQYPFKQSNLFRKNKKNNLHQMCKYHRIKKLKFYNLNFKFK